MKTKDRTSLIIPRELRRWAQTEARERGISFAELVRLAIEELLAARRDRRARDPFFAGLPAGASRSRRGATSFSVKHDEVVRKSIRMPRSS